MTNGSGIYGSNGWGSYGKVRYCFMGDMRKKKTLVFRGGGAGGGGGHNLQKGGHCLLGLYYIVSLPF